MGKKLYCINYKCPRKKCKHHMTHIPKKQELALVANLDGVCKYYITHLVNESLERKENKNGKKKN